MSKAHFVQIFDTITNLAKYAVDLWTAHLCRHDDTKEIKWGVLHYLKKPVLEAKGTESTVVDSPRNSDRGRRQCQGCL